MHLHQAQVFEEYSYDFRRPSSDWQRSYDQDAADIAPQFRLSGPRKDSVRV